MESIDQIENKVKSSMISVNPRNGYQRKNCLPFRALHTYLKFFYPLVYLSDRYPKLFQPAINLLLGYHGRSKLALKPENTYQIFS